MSTPHRLLFASGRVQRVRDVPGTRWHAAVAPADAGVAARSLNVAVSVGAADVT
jgi:hypothetical protein